MSILDITTVTIALMTLNLGILIAIKSPHKARYLFFILCISVTSWLLTNWFSFVLKDFSQAMFTSRLTFIFAGLIALTFTLFTLYFPKKIEKSTINLLIIIIIGLVLSLLGGSKLVVDTVIKDSRDGYYNVRFGSMYPGYALFILGYFSYGFITLFRQLKSNTGVEKLKTKYVLAGFLISVLFGVSTNLVYPLLYVYVLGINVETTEKIYTSSMYGPLSTVFMVGFISYAIIRYRFMDIRIIIRKSLIYSILFAILIGLAAFGIILLSKYITSALNVTFILGATFISVALALLFYPAKKLIQKTINKIVFSKTPVYEDQIVLVKQTLQNGKEFKKLFAKMENILITTLKTEEIFVAIKSHQENSLEEHYSRNLICSPISQDSPLIKYLTEKRTLLVKEEIPYLIDENASQKDILTQMEKFLSKAGAEIVLPLFQDEKIIGLLLLGKKTNQESYSANDIGFLESFQKDFSYALYNTLLYEAALARAKQSA